MLKRTARRWMKGAKKLNRAQVSYRIKKAVNAIELDGSATLRELRLTVAKMADVSLEAGHARAFFEKRIQMRLALMATKKRPNKKKKKAKPGGGEAGELRHFEIGRMAYEDIQSESLYKNTDQRSDTEPSSSQK